MKSFAYEALGYFRTVGVRGIDQIDTQFEGTTENAAAFFRVIRLAPSPIADDPHGSVAETAYGEIDSNGEGRGSGRGGSGHDASDARRQGTRRQGNEGTKE
jgi:hypothetical protein